MHDIQQEVAMQILKPFGAVVVLVLVVLLLGSTPSLQQPAQPFAFPGQQGWSGPHPSELRSFFATLDANLVTTVITTSAPGTNGFIITDISLSMPATFSNTAEDVELATANAVLWRNILSTTNTGSWNPQATSLSFKSGIPIRTGEQLVIRRPTARPYPVSVTLTGHVW